MENLLSNIAATCKFWGTGTIFSRTPRGNFLFTCETLLREQYDCRSCGRLDNPRITAVMVLSKIWLEQFNFEKARLRGKDLLANHCREMLAGELCSPSSKHFKRKMLYVQRFRRQSNFKIKLL
jgi:hypothetical protein